MHLSFSDAGWLYMEEPHNLMMISALLEFATPASRQRLAAVVQERLLTHERFRMRVDESRSRPRWQAAEVDMGYHLRSEHLDSRFQLSSRIDELISQPLDRNRPLWQFHLFEFEGRSALLARLHHALGDGVALMRVLMNLADPAQAGPLRPPVPRPHLGAWPGAFYRLLRLIFAPSDPPNPLKGALGTRKCAASSRVFQLADLKNQARGLGVNLNDLLMVYLNRALRDYLVERGQQVEELELRAVLPVDLRHYRDEHLGNEFGMVFLSLPIAQAHSQSEVRLIRSRLEGLKASPEASVVAWLIRLLAVLPSLLDRLLVGFFGTKASLVATNLPGPRRPLELAGCRLDKIVYWVPMSGRLGLGVSFVSYAGQLQMGVISDAGLIPDPGRLVELFERNCS
jgi:diacylglycerol O-acyltransferase